MSFQLLNAGAINRNAASEVPSKILRGSAPASMDFILIMGHEIRNQNMDWLVRHVRLPGRRDRRKDAFFVL